MQYACADYQRLLAGHCIIPSMSRQGDCWDNAPQERFFGTLKGELVPHLGRLPRKDARREVFDFIEAFYYRQRLHSSLGYLSPADFGRLSAVTAA